MQTRPRVRRTGASRFQASRVLVGCLIALGVSACSDSGGDDVPTTADAGNSIELPNGSLDDGSGVPGTDGPDVGTPGADVVPPSDGTVIIEPPGSRVAESERALFEFLGQRFDSGSDFDVWSCRDGNDETSGIHFGRPDSLDPETATTLDATGRVYADATAGQEDFGISYEVTSNDEFGIVYEVAFAESDGGEDGTVDGGEDTDDEFLDALLESGLTFETFEEFQRFVAENGLQDILGDIQSVEEFEQLLADDREEGEEGSDGGPDGAEPREPTLLDRSIVDELTSVRIGPGRTWSGFSMLGNSPVNCTEIAR